MKRGFTLVELLSVIVIISLLTAFAFPKIVDFVNNLTGKTDEVVINMVNSAVELYISENKSSYPKINGNSYCVDLQQLIEEEYLKAPIKISDEDVSSFKSIQISYDDGFDYKLVDSSACIEKIKELTEEEIFTATQNYIDEYIDLFPAKNGNSYCISLEDLIKAGYLPNPVIVSGENITYLKTIQVKYSTTSGYTYEIVESDDCVEKIIKLTEDDILAAAQEYVVANEESYVKVVGNSYCITLDQIIAGGYLESPVELDGIDITNEKSIQLKYTSTGWTYELALKSACVVNEKIICNAVSVATKGTYTVGDKYTCEVKPGTSYTFYVLSSDTNSVNFMYPSAITTSEWLTKDKYCEVNGGLICLTYSTFHGPITAMSNLHTATSGWSNIDNINISYSDSEYGGISTSVNASGNYITKIYDGSGNLNISYTNMKARLPKLSESKTTLSFLTSDCWTLSSSSTSKNAYIVNGSTYTTKDITGSYGICPVINVSKLTIR